ncbi:hypothetical protein EV356DRAFT_159899 [Viridothelium virens]|uniref:Branchpoint-bridging protein n=1 Tax=Viridothelium virens TaxID=1048519 RepID=A0A6A6H8D9_VIRVR|nr:hypothetical protein EV356DRAFT_159899 [Viridothelium virens]
MAWRNQGITGSNNIPLGTRRRFGGGDSQPSTPADSGYNPSEPSAGFSDLNGKRGRSPVAVETNEDAIKRRKKRNRWGDASENKAAGLMGLPTAITGNMTSEQLEAYTIHLRIEEISQKLRINDVVPADGDRSPSPPPQYDNFGRRTNTRETRYRKRLEDERHKLVEKAIKVIPNYHPPSDYRRPTKTQEKVYVPVNDYPEINFIGLLIGPRGNTLKKMETESLAKIAIRGKGSVKEGKGRSDAAHTSNQEEDLHCLIMADTEEKVNKAKKLIHQVIETLQSQKAKMNSSETSSVNSPPSMARFAMTKTKLARTVARLAIVSTIVHSRRTTRQVSFVASVVMPDIWRVIVPSVNAVKIGVRTPRLSVDVHASRAVMLLNASMRHSCRKSQVVGQSVITLVLRALKVDRVVTTTPAPTDMEHSRIIAISSLENQNAGGPPPWARGGGGAPGAGSGGDNNYGGASAPAPWAQQGSAPWQQPPPPAGGQSNYGSYAGYGAPGYGDQGGRYQAPDGYLAQHWLKNLLASLPPLFLRRLVRLFTFVLLYFSTTFTSTLYF